MTQNQTIVFFDGVCNLCNKSIDYVIRHDRSGKIMFAPLQSDTARRLLLSHNQDPSDLDTIILLKENQVYTKSAAAIEIMGIIGGWLVIPAFIGRCTPTFIADALYSFIARNRYRWFGKGDTCRIPTPEEAARFLD